MLYFDKSNRQIDDTCSAFARKSDYGTDAQRVASCLLTAHAFACAVFLLKPKRSSWKTGIILEQKK